MILYSLLVLTTVNLMFVIRLTVVIERSVVQLRGQIDELSGQGGFPSKGPDRTMWDEE